MPTRIINRPSDITLKPPAEGGKVDSPTFNDFVRGLLNLPIWGSNFKYIRKANAIDQALDAETEQIRLAEEDWETLCDIAKEPPILQGQTHASYGYHAWVMRQVVPYLSAIIDAEVEKPAPKPSEDTKD